MRVYLHQCPHLYPESLKAGKLWPAKCRPSVWLMLRNCSKDTFTFHQVSSPTCFGRMQSWKRRIAVLCGNPAACSAPNMLGIFSLNWASVYRDLVVSNKDAAVVQSSPASLIWEKELGGEDEYWNEHACGCLCIGEEGVRRSTVRAGWGQPVHKGPNKMIKFTCCAIDNRQFVLINFLNETVVIYSILTIKKSWTHML